MGKSPFPDCGMRYRREGVPGQAQKPVSFESKASSGPTYSAGFVAPKNEIVDCHPDSDAASFQCVRIVSQNKRESGRPPAQRLRDFHKAVDLLNKSIPRVSSPHLKLN